MSGFFQHGKEVKLQFLCPNKYPSTDLCVFFCKTAHRFQGKVMSATGIPPCHCCVLGAVEACALG